MEEEAMLHQNTMRRLAAATIHRALSDSRGIECSNPVDALVWLGSRAAEPYFQLVELPQDRFLLRSGWLGRVLEVIAENLATPEQIAVLQTTYDYLTQYDNKSAEPH